MTDRLKGVVLARFLDKVRIDGECWTWAACRMKGYGRFSIDGRVHFAHRVAFVLGGRELNASMVLDHLCRNPSCVRPSHLRQVSQWENTMADGSLAPAKKQLMRTHCRVGHPYDAKNTYRNRGKRFCCTCHREGAVERYAAKRAAREVE